MPQPNLPHSRNRLLAALPASELERLRPHLDPIDLPLKKVLITAGEPVLHAYFPASGLGSLIARLEDGSGVEVGMMGRDGMVGTAVVLHAETTTTDCIIQVAGSGWRIRAAALREAMGHSPALNLLLLRYVQAFHNQTTQTSACNARHNLPERLARWLLMTQDRVDGDELPLTQEFLSIMLAVRRSGVTVAAHTLQEAGLIRYRRSLITVLDRPGLEGAACACYAIMRQQFERMLGSDR
jgi:CRP-like cAMP-binding protein